MLTGHAFDRGFKPGGAQLGQKGVDFLKFLQAGMATYGDIRTAEATEEAAEQARRAAEAQEAAARAAADAVAAQTAAAERARAEDIIAGVPNWLLLLGGAGAATGIAYAIWGS